MAKISDVLVHHNNHVRFIFPTAHGRLASFYDARTGDTPRGWLFANHEGDSERAVFATGDWADAERLINLLAAQGFAVQKVAGGDVPMSNGKSESRIAFTKRLLSPGGTQNNAPEFRYSDREIAVVRTGKTDYFLFLSAVMAGAEK